MEKLKLANKHKIKSQSDIFFDIMEFTADRIVNDKKIAVIVKAVFNF